MNQDRKRAAFDDIINRHGLCATKDKDLYRSHLVGWMLRAYEAALASPEVQKQPQHKTLLQVWRSTDSCGEFWSWDEADQYDYDRALPENRRIIQIIKEG